MLILRARRAPVDQSRLFGQLRGRKTALSIAQEMTHVQTDAQPMLLQKVKSQSSEIAAVDVFQQEGALFATCQRAAKSLSRRRCRAGEPSGGWSTARRGRRKAALRKTASAEARQGPRRRSCLRARADQQAGEHASAGADRPNQTEDPFRHSRGRPVSRKSRGRFHQFCGSENAHFPPRCRAARKKARPSGRPGDAAARPQGRHMVRSRAFPRQAGRRARCIILFRPGPPACGRALSPQGGRSTACL